MIKEQAVNTPGEADDKSFNKVENKQKIHAVIGHQNFAAAVKKL